MKARDQFNFSELEQWLDNKRVTEIECLVPDLTGVARSSPKTAACGCPRPWWPWA
jgi:type IV secretory pathway ATPase VirB11/archaellum biosynthesis ATPase